MLEIASSNDLCFKSDSSDVSSAANAIILFETSSSTFLLRQNGIETFHEAKKFESTCLILSVKQSCDVSFLS